MLIITYYSAPGLARQATFKKIKVKLDLLSDIDILLMVEKGIRGGICHTIHRYGNGNNKIIMSYTFGCNLFIWMGNVTRVACK